MKKALTILALLASPILAHAYTDPLASTPPTPSAQTTLGKPTASLKLSPLAASPIPAAPTASVIPSKAAPTPTPTPVAAPKPIAASAPVATVPQADSAPANPPSPPAARSTSTYTIDRIGEMQSQIAILKVEAELAKAKAAALNTPGMQPQTGASWAATSEQIPPPLKAIVGSSQSPTAIFLLPDNTSKSVNEGSRIGPYTISKITPNSVTLKDKHGKSVVINL